MDRVRRGMWVTIGMGLIYTVITGIMLLMFSHQVIGFFSDDPEVIANGVLAMKYFCPFYFLLSIMHSLAGTIRGTGKTVPPMVILLVSLCLFRIFWIQAILPAFDTLDGVYMLYPVSWTIGAVLMSLMPGKENGGWKRSKQIRQSM